MATRVLTLRLEEDAWRSVKAFQHHHALESPSSAIRAMLDIASHDVKQLEEALRRAAWREGTRNAAKKLREEIDIAVAKALGVANANGERG